MHFIVPRGPIDDDNILDSHADSWGFQDLESIRPGPWPQSRAGDDQRSSESRQQNQCG
jgi:hypothetical protein